MQNSYDGAVIGGGTAGIDLGSPHIGGLAFGIAMNEHDVEVSPLLNEKFESGRNCPIALQQVGVDPRDRHVATVIEAESFEMARERQVGRAVGNEDAAERHATSWKSDICAPGGSARYGSRSSRLAESASELSLQVPFIPRSWSASTG